MEGAFLLCRTAELSVGGLRVSVSIGTHTARREGLEPRLLLWHADQALYRAKGSGRNRTHSTDRPDGVDG